MSMEKTVKTYILCHDQNFIVESIKNKKYDQFINYYFVFMGMGDTNNIDEIENVIICKNLDNNIEIQKRHQHSHEEPAVNSDAFCFCVAK